MKELVIISGKGGTGKTSLTASLCTLAQNKVMVDCDVDAADMHLLLHPEVEKTVEFYSGKQAEIDKQKCVQCGKCTEICKFEAISEDYTIDEIKCEGCGACYFNCPANAINFEKVKSGEWFESNTRFGKLIHAKLGIAEENSGKLVSEIRNHARIVANKNKNELIIVDGSPGIGCPVIASISGASLVLIVTEPTLSGLHDAKRVFKLTQHFNIPATMCINKYDINTNLSDEMENYCDSNNIELLGKISYNKIFTEAMLEGKTIPEFSENSDISKEIKKIWNKLSSKLEIKN